MKTFDLLIEHQLNNQLVIKDQRGIMFPRCRLMFGMRLVENA